MFTTRIFALLAAAAAAAGVATAQTAVTTPGGTSGAVPVYTGASTIGSSVVTQTNGNVGIGTTTPNGKLDVNGGLSIGGDPVIAETAIPFSTAGSYVIASGGRLHGTYTLSVEGASIVQTVRLLVDANQFDNHSTLQILENHCYSVSVMSNFRILLSASGGTVYLVMNLANLNNVTFIHAQYLGDADYPYGGPVFGGTLAGTEVGVGALGIGVNEGWLGVGTATPTQALEVNGNAKVDGNYVLVGPSGALLYGDTANAVVTAPGSGSVYLAPVGVNGTRVAQSNGSLYIGGPGQTGASLVFPDGTTQTTAYSGGSGITQSNGNVVIAGDLQVAGNIAPVTTSQGGYFGWNRLTGGTGETDFINNEGGGPGGFAFFNTPPSGTPQNLLMFLAGNGYLGIGTQTPGARLEVDGSIKLTPTGGGSIMFTDGSSQNTAWNGIATGGDYAESVDVSGSRQSYEPGDVLVIDPETPGNFLKCSAAYSTSVAGIYSTKPGLRGRRQKTDISAMAGEVPMAMVGIVPTKVSAEGGPIKPGDLLVTSARAGYAMKGSDRSQLAGAIVGKAMGSLDSGTGVIEVLVSLQ